MINTPNTHRPVPDHVDVAVVGGGLAGLAAAATAARAGSSVVVIEARRAPGGRARSDEVDGFVVNHGAHALYRRGAGMAVLKMLGVHPRGGIPRQGGFGWWIDGRRVPFRHLSEAGGTDGLRTLRRMALPGEHRTDLEGRSMQEWIDQHVPDRAHGLARMIVRTSCYTADLTNLDAAAAFGQLSRSLRGVLYLHGGWGSLVVGLAGAAQRAGVVTVEDRVEAVSPAPTGHEVALRSGATITAGAVVLAAGGPAQADRVLGGGSGHLHRWAGEARPVVVTCLDAAVASKAGQRAVATYGLEEPVYLVDHRASARIGPKGSAVYHGMYYEPDARPDVDHRAVLEAMLDAQHPGWAADAVSGTHRQRSVVAHDRPRPGVAPPPVAVPDVEGVFVAGDWLTGHGMLADAALGSAAEAGRASAAHAGPVRGRSYEGAVA